MTSRPTGGPRPTIGQGRPQPPASLLRLADTEDTTVTTPPADDNVGTGNDSSVILADDSDVKVEEKPIVTKAKTAEKMVRITMDKDHSTVIGGIRYNLKKDKTYPVPLEVAKILQKSPLGLLKPNF